MTAIFISLAFCFVLIGAVCGNFKCHDPLEDEEFDVPGNNVLMTLYKNSNELSNGNGNIELKQFVCDLSERYIVIGKAFDYLAQQKCGFFRRLSNNSAGLRRGFSLSPKKKSAENQKSAKNNLLPSIRACMIDEFELLKTVDELDRPMAQLMYKLYKSISVLKHPIIAGSSGQTAKIQKLNEEIIETTFFLAERLEIPKKQIEPNKNEEKLDQNQLIKELGQLWFLYRKTWKYGKKDYEKRKRENRKHAKRMLQLVINFSTDGVDGLANLKSEKKSQRRRRKRGNAKTAAVIIIFVVFLCALSVLVIKHYSSEHLAKKQQQPQQEQQQRDIVTALAAHGAAVDELKTLAFEHVEQPVQEQQRQQRKQKNRKQDSKKLYMRREQSLMDQREQQEQAEHGDILYDFSPDNILEPKSISFADPRTAYPVEPTTPSQTSSPRQQSMGHSERDFGEYFGMDFSQVSQFYPETYQPYFTE